MIPFIIYKYSVKLPVAIIIIPRIISIIPIINPAVAKPLPLNFPELVSFKPKIESIVEETPQGMANIIIPTNDTIKPAKAFVESFNDLLFSFELKH